MLKIRQYFCKHDYELVATHGSTSQNLWQCKKCDVFVVQNWGVGLYYKCKEPNIGGWIYETEKVNQQLH